MALTIGKLGGAGGPAASCEEVEGRCCARAVAWSTSIASMTLALSASG